MSNIIISIDQSLSKFAIIVWEDSKIINKTVLRTGSTKARSKTKGVDYFDSPEEQMLFICSELEQMVEAFKPNHIILEGLSFGSVGNATRDLAGLYYLLKGSLFLTQDFSLDNWTTTAPTSIKALARNFLPLEQQTELSKKTSKPIKVKMDKAKMIAATLAATGDLDFFSGYETIAKGKEDLADAYWLGRKYLEDNGLWMD